jgi:hypothetical protein
MASSAGSLPPQSDGCALISGYLGNSSSRASVGRNVEIILYVANLASSDILTATDSVVH